MQCVRLSAPLTTNATISVRKSLSMSTHMRPSSINPINTHIDSITPVIFRLTEALIHNIHPSHLPTVPRVYIRVLDHDMHTYSHLSNLFMFEFGCGYGWSRDCKK